MSPFDPTSAPDGARSQRGPACPGCRVLLAEDDAPMRDLLAEQLKRAGCDVLLAEDGLHLLTRLDGSMSPAACLPFDAIVSDVRMPGADGMRILQWLRAQGSRIPVVLISAFGTVELHAEAQRLGAVLVDKPFEIAQLAAALRDAIGRGAGRAEPGPSEAQDRAAGPDARSNTELTCGRARGRRGRGAVCRAHADSRAGD